jgi:uncharacterized membrane protein YjdF
MNISNKAGALRLPASLIDSAKATVRQPHALIAFLTSVILLLLSIVAAHPGSTYRWSFAFLIPLVWAVYGLRNKLALLPSHYAVFAGAVVFHNLGVFGSYESVLWHLRFDTYVHFAFGFAAGLILARSLAINWNLRHRTLWWAVPVFVLGAGALHELFECFTTLVMGPERGMLKLRPDQPFDTQKDLLNNLLGAIAALVVYHFARNSRPRRERRD